MDMATAQQEIRRAYFRGGPGAIVSGCVWLASAITASVAGVPRGFTVLFFGGMLIFPIAALIVRTLLRREPPSKDNPGGMIAFETVFPMIAGLLAAWLMIPYRPEFVLPMSAVAVGTHYFGFRSAYGDWTNWILGGLMSIVGIMSIISGTPSSTLVPYLIALIEIAFGLWLTTLSILHDHPPQSPTNAS